MAQSVFRRRRVGVAGALLVAALAAPGLAGTLADGAVVAANGECLAWFGSRGEGICMGYSSGNGLNVGTPDIGVFGPEYGNGNGIGIVTGPLLPGTTINEGISP